MRHFRFLTIVLLAGTVFSLSATSAKGGNASDDIAVWQNSVQTDPTAVIEGDPQLIKGQLANGLTYYIRHNGNPASCADFYIVHNVGALQEEDSQNGLAHFLEHMAFNGTRHFPGKGIISFLEKEGVRFGYNINAYTNRTETVYNLSSVPLRRESFIDSVLLVLHDWSCDITCDPVEIDEERGVISEEYRRGNDQRSRMAAKQAALLYNGSKHSRRSVIGTLDIINGFKPEEILAFYHKWYRPDLQAVVIVGDFDPAEMETRVRKAFSDIGAATNPASKGFYDIPPINGPLFRNMTDPEISIRTLKMMIRQPFPARSLRNTEFFYRDCYSRLIVTRILSERFSAAVKREGCPVKSAVVVTNPYGTDFYNTLFTLLPKGESEFEGSLEFLERELKRCREFGFSDDEIEAARFQVGKRLRIDKEMDADAVTSEELVKTYIDSWLQGFPECSPADLAEVKREVLGSIGNEEIRRMLRSILDSPERIYSFVINEKETSLLPSEARMREIIGSVAAENIEPQYIKYDRVDLSAEVDPGTIAGVQTLKGNASELWTLGNGAKVWFTQSAPVRSDCHIAMDIYFNTGHKRCPASPATEVFVNDYIPRIAGFRGMTGSALKNRPECYGVNWLISRHTCDKSVINVTADRNNAEKAFEIFHLLVSEPYLGSEKDLAKAKENRIGALNKEKSRLNAFLDEYRSMVYGGNPYAAETDTAAVNGVTMATLRQIYDSHYTKFSDMRIFISSDLDKETVKEYVCKYIASLSGDYNYSTEKVRPLDPAYDGKTQKEWNSSQSSAPKTLIKFRSRARLGNSPADRATVEILDYIMSARYLAQIREARGGTYSVAFSSEHFGKKNAYVESLIDFQTRPELKDILLADTYAVFEKMCAQGPTEEELDAAKKYLIKADREKDHKMRDSLQEKNRVAEKAVFLGEFPDPDFAATVETVSAADVRKAARKLYSGDRLVVIYNETE